LQNNRMEGDASVINLLPKRDIPKDLLETLPPHRFISDCGDPQVSHFACIAAYFCLSKICSTLKSVFSPLDSALLPYVYLPAGCIRWWVAGIVLCLCSPASSIPMYVFRRISHSIQTALFSFLGSNRMHPTPTIMVGSFYLPQLLSA